MPETGEDRGVTPHSLGDLADVARTAPGNAPAFLRWDNAASEWRPVAQQAAQANLAGGATLADVITAHNALLAKLRTLALIAT
jgi:hypothetical protein